MKPRGIVGLAILLLPAFAGAADVPWRNDLGVSLGLFSGSGIRLARRFPEGVRVGLAAGFLHVEAADPDSLGTHVASIGTEVMIDLTRGRVLRVLGIGGLGWTVATEFDPDQDGIAEDFEALALGAGVGLEVLYWRNLSLTVQILLGMNLLTAKATGFPELTLSYGF